MTDKLKPLREKWSKLIGEFTFDDIVRELEKPGRDPRDMFKVFKYREDIHELKDLKPDMICAGLVTNVTNFGAFVDIGVHQDGLVHISELSHQFVEDPRKVVSPGDQIQVKVLAVDLAKSQISLTMKLEEKPKMEARPQAQPQPRREPRAGGPGKPRPAQAGGRGKGGALREGGPRTAPVAAAPRDPNRPRPIPRGEGGARPSHQGQGGGRSSNQNQGGGPKRPQGSPFNNPFAALLNTPKK